MTTLATGLARSVWPRGAQPVSRALREPSRNVIAAGYGSHAMTIPQSNATIDNVLTEFLAEQRERLSDRTFQRYEEIVELLRHSLDRYAYNSLDHDERQRWAAKIRVT